MATRSKTLPARKPERSDESLLLRSAESLGRMIGTLQRQLDEATRRLSQFGSDAPAPPVAQESPAGAARATSRPKSASAARKSPGTAKRNGSVSASRAKRQGARAGGATRGNGAAGKARSRKAAAKKTRSR